MHKLLGSLTALLIALFTISVQAETITMVNSNWAPYKGDELPRGGVVTDIARQAFERAGYKVKVVGAPWKRALKGAYSGQYDVVPAIWFSNERAERLTFSRPILQSRVVFISKPETAFEFSTLDDLTGQVIGVGAGWGYPEQFKKADNFIKEEALNLEANVKKLVHDRLKLIVGEEIATRYTVSKLFQFEQVELHYSQNAIQENDLHIAVSKLNKNHKEITERFNKAIAEMHNDGTFKTILKFHGVEGVKAPK